MIAQGKLDKSQIESLIPHKSGMCLLEEVCSYSHEIICCRTSTHLNSDNPLKQNGVLSQMHLIEYAAQAIAIHGGILDCENSSESRLGYIAAVKSVEWFDFDVDAKFLEIHGTVVLADDNSKLYDLDVMHPDGTKACATRVLVALQNAGEN